MEQARSVISDVVADSEVTLKVARAVMDRMLVEYNRAEVRNEQGYIQTFSAREGAPGEYELWVSLRS